MRLGIDIGGTKTAAVMVNAFGSVVARRTMSSGRGPDEVIEVAAALARNVAAGLGGLAVVTAVGACIPGLVDPDRGTVRHALNLDIDEIDLADRLAASLGMPIAIDNDVKAAALGAHHTLGARPTGTFAYLNIGTGLGAGIVRDGVVVRGRYGAAGEIGHLPAGTNRVCQCGQTGCLETLASGSAFTRIWGRSDADPFAAAATGDRRAAAAIKALSRGLGLAVELLVLAGGAEQVVIGGGLTRLGGPLRAAITGDLTRRAEQSPFLASLALPDLVRFVPHGLPVGALGAALLARDVRGRPAEAVLEAVRTTHEG